MIRLGLLSRRLQNPTPSFHLHRDHPRPSPIASHLGDHDSLLAGLLLPPPTPSGPFKTNSQREAFKTNSQIPLALGLLQWLPSHRSKSPSPPVTCEPLKFFRLISCSTLLSPPLGHTSPILFLIQPVAFSLESFSPGSPCGSCFTSSFTQM